MQQMGGQTPVSEVKLTPLGSGDDKQAGSSSSKVAGQTAGQTAGRTVTKEPSDPLVASRVQESAPLSPESKSDRESVNAFKASKPAPPSPESKSGEKPGKARDFFSKFFGFSKSSEPSTPPLSPGEIAQQDTLRKEAQLQKNLIGLLDSANKRLQWIDSKLTDGNTNKDLNSLLTKYKSCLNQRKELIMVRTALIGASAAIHTEAGVEPVVQSNASKDLRFNDVLLMGYEEAIRLHDSMTKLGNRAETLGQSIDQAKHKAGDEGQFSGAAVAEEKSDAEEPSTAERKEGVEGTEIKNLEADLKLMALAYNDLNRRYQSITRFLDSPDPINLQMQTEIIEAHAERVASGKRSTLVHSAESHQFVLNDSQVALLTKFLTRGRIGAEVEFNVQGAVPSVRSSIREGEGSFDKDFARSFTLNGQHQTSPGAREGYESYMMQYFSPDHKKAIEDVAQQTTMGELTSTVMMVPFNQNLDFNLFEMSVSTNVNPPDMNPSENVKEEKPEDKQKIVSSLGPEYKEVKELKALDLRVKKNGEFDGVHLTTHFFRRSNSEAEEPFELVKMVIKVNPHNVLNTDFNKVDASVTLSKVPLPKIPPHWTFSWN